MKIYIGFKNFC